MRADRVVHDQCINRSANCRCLSAGTAQGYHCHISSCIRVKNNTGLIVFSLLAFRVCSGLIDRDSRKLRHGLQDSPVIDDGICDILLYDSGNRSANTDSLSKCKGDLDEDRIGVDRRIRVDRTFCLDCSCIRCVLDISVICQSIIHICISDHCTNNVLRNDDRDKSAHTDHLRSCNSDENHDYVLFQ